MMLLVGDLHPGDVIHLRDWFLHVAGVDPPAVTGGVPALAVTEFDFLLHPTATQLFDVVERVP
jgi:hypothetical protein